MALSFLQQSTEDPYVLSISEFFSSVSAVLTFHKCHVKEPSTITKSQIQKHSLPVFLITKLNKLPPFIHTKMANSHTSCHPSSWPSPGPLLTLQSSSAAAAGTGKRKSTKTVIYHMEHSLLDSGHYTMYTSTLPSLSPVGNASAVEAFSSGLLSSEQKHKSATSNSIYCIF